MIINLLLIIFLFFIVVIYFLVKKRENNNIYYSYEIVNKNKNIANDKVKKVIIEAIKLYKNKYNRNL